MIHASFDEMWRTTILELLDQPIIESRNGKTKEIIGFHTKMRPSPYTVLCNPVRNMSIRYASAEFLWMCSETQDTRMIEYYAPSYEKYTEDHVAWGAYGPRIVPQFSSIHRLLMHEPNSRQAVIRIWSSEDLKACARPAMRPKDIPCTLSLQFLVRDKMLHMITTMRSNDIWLGMPYDVFVFTTMQRLFANGLGIATGSYTHNVGSMHLYQKDFEKAIDVREQGPYEIAAHSYTDHESLFHDCDAALRAEREYRHDGKRVYITGQIWQDLVNACIDRENAKFHSAAFNMRS